MDKAFARWRPEIDEAISEWIPREIDEEYLAEFFGDPSYQYEPRALQHALADPIWDLLDRGGKRWRAVLFLVVVEALGEDPEKYLEYACLPEILHNGTIIVDDIEDQAQTRRGEPTLHRTHGVDVALNAGNALYFIPLKIIARNDDSLSPKQRLAAYEMLTYEFNRTHLGQGTDIFWHSQREIDIDEQQYYEMCACKTGCLVRIVMQLAAIVTDQDQQVRAKLADVAEQMAISFQIMDDVLDVTSSLEGSEDFGKEFGNDIKEGKKTLMTIHVADNASAEEVSRLETLLWQEENTAEEIKEVLDIFQKYNAVEYARQRAEEFAASAELELDELDLETEPEQELRTFIRFLIERDK